MAINLDFIVRPTEATAKRLSKAEQRFRKALEEYMVEVEESVIAQYKDVVHIEINLTFASESTGKALKVRL